MCRATVAVVGIILVALYTVGLQGRRLRALLVAAAMAPVVTAAVVITSKSGFETGATLARLALLLAALAVGDAQRGRLAVLRARAEGTERRPAAAAVSPLHQERPPPGPDPHHT